MCEIRISSTGWSSRNPDLVCKNHDILNKNRACFWRMSLHSSDRLLPHWIGEGRPFDTIFEIKLSKTFCALPADRTSNLWIILMSLECNSLGQFTFAIWKLYRMSKVLAKVPNFKVSDGQTKNWCLLTLDQNKNKKLSTQIVH